MGEGNINKDIWIIGRARNMKSKNKSGIEGDVERFSHFVCFLQQPPSGPWPPHSRGL